MAVNLTKGNRVDLKKEDPSLKRIRVGLGWGWNKTDTGAGFDLDVSAFGLANDASDEPKKVGADLDYFVFYGNTRSVDGSIIHSGDNKTGEGGDPNGDDETIIVDLTRLAASVDEISFIVTIHEATERRQNFGQIPKAAIRLYNDETNTLLAEYNLEEDFSSETAIQFGSMYKKDGSVSAFKAVGAGYNAGLKLFCESYGIATE